MSTAFLAAVSGFFMQWASVFWATMRETAPFLVLGLFLAGMLHVLVPSKIILWALGNRGWRGAVKGALIGTPLPLCSCGVVPTALALRRQGASLSATTAFTISTPETSIDVIAITAALLPSAFLAVRPIAALFLSVVVGILVEFVATTTKEQLRMNVMKLSRVMDVQSPGAAPSLKGNITEICRVCGLLEEQEHSHGFGARLGAIFSYAFSVFFRDIATWLILGLVMAAALQVLLPAEGFEASWLAHHPGVQILLVMIAGIPLYSCATATTPLAAVLLAKGMSPGAALALLLVGPATNIGNIFALKRELGARVTAAYYGGLFVFCWVLGMGFSVLWPWLRTIAPVATDFSGGGAQSLVSWMPGWIEVASAWLLVLLTLNAWTTAFLHRGHHHGHEGHAH